MNKRILTIAGIGLLFLTIYAGLAGNETILPTVLILLFLCLIGLISTTSSTMHGTDASISEKAAQAAIGSFAVLVAALSLLISLFLPEIAIAYGLTGLFDGDFVRVSINDAHELAYSTCLLLIFDIIFLVRHRRKPSWPLNTDGPTSVRKPA